MEQKEAGDLKENIMVWQLIAWVLGIIGAVIAYAAGPKEDPRVKHWIRMSIAFFIVVVVAYVLTIFLAFLPFVGLVINLVIWLAVLAVWVLGIIKIVQGDLWKPPIVSSIAEKINI
ncbi:MAG: DUF4870 domain-containing protein [Aeropyrum sp.]|nr:DUF4870 domain-containing protein [Aeropyrum sp.]MCE4615685.1 DUF4870 domain-containing protein [Aeropyrum sp.]